MEISTQHLEFVTKHPIYTLNHLNDKTTDIWVVFHGYGQLVSHFIRRFDVLDPEKCYIVAPQGLSRFYLSNDGTKVGASWMTKEDRETEMDNQKRYLDVVFERMLSGVDWTCTRLNLLGFSQGVTTMIRYLVHSQLKFSQMVLWAGDLPNELKKADLAYIDFQVNIHMVIGTEDQYYNKEVINKQVVRWQEYTGVSPRLTLFDGKHEVSREVLKSLI